MKSLTLSLIPLSLTLACVFATGAESKDKIEKKNITVITAEGKAGGASEISREAVKECIVSLPTTEAIEPEVVSDSRYLKEIDGDPAKNGWTKPFSAKITVNYMVYKKDLLIVTTPSLEGKEPTMKEIEKRLPQVKEFDSNPADGGTFAG